MRTTTRAASAEQRRSIAWRAARQRGRRGGLELKGSARRRTTGRGWHGTARGWDVQHETMGAKVIVVVK